MNYPSYHATTNNKHYYNHGYELNITPNKLRYEYAPTMPKHGKPMSTTTCGMTRLDLSPILLHIIVPHCPWAYNTTIHNLKLTPADDTMHTLMFSFLTLRCQLIHDTNIYSCIGF